MTVYVLQELSNLSIVTGVIFVVRQVYLLFFDGTDEAFGAPTLPVFAHLSHTHDSLRLTQHRHLGSSLKQDPLVRVVDLRLASAGQDASQAGQGRFLIQIPTQCVHSPGTDTAKGRFQAYHTT